jgi:ribulose-phosphate 3-epimerase
MDGHFVPNITFGPVVLESIKKHCNVPLDAHLMIENVDKYIPEFIKAGADMVSIHIENNHHIHRSLELIKNLGAKVGSSDKPWNSSFPFRGGAPLCGFCAFDVGKSGLWGAKIHPKVFGEVKKTKGDGKCHQSQGAY